MSLAIVYSRARLGIDAPLVTVEVHLSGGLSAFNIVGLPEASVKESRDRVRSAVINSNFIWPNERITVNLAPADLPKEGGRFDLPIAIGIIAAIGNIDQRALEGYELCGELALSGEIRSIIGEIPTAYACHQSNRICILPKENAAHAILIKGASIIGSEHLLHVYHHILGQQPLPFEQLQQIEQGYACDVDLQDVVGQPMAKRALEIAASGAHNLLFSGPAGTGKSMLAQRLTTILPIMTDEEALESAAIYSVCGRHIDAKTWKNRPFRTPHHTASGVALVGGGSNPRPGEISLSHNGVLFLDELPEFDRKVLDVLREPLETGTVTISRASRQAEFPARFQLIAAMNPSPTGDVKDGRATPDQVLRYLNRLSGPFLDRIDIQLDVPRLPKGALTQNPERGESSEVVRQRVAYSRGVQMQRAGKPNALLSGREVDHYCPLSAEDALFLENAIEKLKLSTRAYHKILKVSRTIADIGNELNINRQHISEALGYRAMDRLVQRLKSM
ncbi:MAG: magnesium chelatase family protein [Phenylobacterium sp.]|jgi:magnesium chelatase family protein